jgi:outer membrane protein OmpA-like peptidoglycan-associated protein
MALVSRNAGAAALAALALAACRSLPATYVVLLPDDDGAVGKVELRGRGTRVLEQPRSASGFDAQRAPVGLSQAGVEQRFGPALRALPERPAHFVLYFRSDTTELTPESRALLPEALAEAARRPAADISVVGHTDRMAPADYNARLALRRARAIRDRLVGLGADPASIEVTSHGESNPLVPTPDGAREPRNRRVEITIR